MASDSATVTTPVLCPSSHIVVFIPPCHKYRMTCLHHITCDIIGDRNFQICYHLLGSELDMWLLIDQNVTLRHVPRLGEGQGCGGSPG